MNLNLNFICSPFEVATRNQIPSEPTGDAAAAGKQIFQLFISSQRDATGEFGGGKLGSPLFLRPADGYVITSSSIDEFPVQIVSEL